LKKVRRSSLDPEDITEELIDGYLYTSVSGLGLRPDLLIRTSGENRLSDFLLWQTSYSVTYFADVLWPEFSLWNFIYALFYYQRRFHYRKQVVEALPSHLEEHCKELFN
jgi:undecaprenyl diphosphate synthase